MKEFLKQNWLWLAIPLLLMAVAVYVLAQGGDGASGEGAYQIF